MGRVTAQVLVSNFPQERVELSMSSAGFEREDRARARGDCVRTVQIKSSEESTRSTASNNQTECHFLQALHSNFSGEKQQCSSLMRRQISSAFQGSSTPHTLIPGGRRFFTGSNEMTGVQAPRITLFFGSRPTRSIMHARATESLGNTRCSLQPSQWT